MLFSSRASNMNNTVNSYENFKDISMQVKDDLSRVNRFKKCYSLRPFR